MVSTSSSPVAEHIDLSACDLVLLVDQSGSMSSEVVPGVSRWDYMMEWLRMAVQEAIKIDSDGIGVGFFNQALTYNPSVTSVAEFDSFVSTLSPSGITYTGAALKEVVDAWLSIAADPGTKPLRVIIFTDGDATDKNNLVNYIKNVVDQMVRSGMADHHLAISFAQVGDDPQATAFLQMLDDGLNTQFDIVDTKSSDWVMTHKFSDLLIQAEID
jgi:Mg-chelatase subunit ChlD